MEHLKSRDSSDVDGSSSEPLLRLGRRGVDYWKSYPLDSAENIRKWERDFVQQRSLSTVDRRSSQVAWQAPDVDLASLQAARRLSLPVGAFNYTKRTSATEESPHHVGSAQVGENVLHSPSETAAMVNRPDQQEHHARCDGSTVSVSWPDTMHPGTASIPSHMLLDAFNQPQSSSSDVFGLNINQEPSSWRGAPPPRFQQQFLW